MENIMNVIRRLFLASCLFLSSQAVFAMETVDINTADAATLAAMLSGIGEKRAQAIVAYREEHGPFQSVDDLVRVSGIGPRVLEENRERMKTSQE